MSNEAAIRIAAGTTSRYLVDGAITTDTDITARSQLATTPTRTRGII